MIDKESALKRLQSKNLLDTFWKNISAIPGIPEEVKKAGEEKRQAEHDKILEGIFGEE